MKLIQLVASVSAVTLPAEKIVIEPGPDVCDRLKFSNEPDTIVELSTDEGIVEYFVQKKLLRAASPIWRKTLDPKSGFKIAAKRRHGERDYDVIPVMDTEPEVLRLLFNILHKRVSKIPKQVSWETLKTFALLVDEYDCVAAVSPVPESWIVNPEHYSEKYTDIGFEEWLFIAKVFDHMPVSKQIIKDITKKMIGDATIPPGNEDESNWRLVRKPGPGLGIEVDTSLIPKMMIGMFPASDELKKVTNTYGIHAN